MSRPHCIGSGLRNREFSIVIQSGEMWAEDSAIESNLSSILVVVVGFVGRLASQSREREEGMID